MNLSQFNQLLQNNLWYGENGTPVKDRYAVTGLLVAPPTGKVWGMDGSHWNRPPVDFQRMKDAYDMRFGIIKGCDGSLNSNYYPDHIAGLKAAGLPFGMYAWLYPGNRVSITAQVNAWWARYSQDVPPLGLFIDAEWTTYAGQTANPSAADLRAAHDLWYQKSGKHATTYTAKGYADQYLKGFDWSREPLWIARYGDSPLLPSGATTYHFWQFTSSLDGKALDQNGNAELDGNLYNGTPEQFAAEYDLPTGGTMLWYRATGNITMRVAASSTSANAQIGEVNQYVLTGDLVETSVQSNGFVLISRVYRNGGFVELPPVAWCGMAYLAEAEAPILTPSVYITHVFSDTLILDGKQYKADFTVENVEYKPQS